MLESRYYLNMALCCLKSTSPTLMSQMGSYDRAEVCELAGLLLLDKLAELQEENVELYRDDRLAVINGSVHAQKVKKRS